MSPAMALIYVLCKTGARWGGSIFARCPGTESMFVVDWDEVEPCPTLATRSETSRGAGTNNGHRLTNSFGDGR